MFSETLYNTACDKGGNVPVIKWNLGTLEWKGKKLVFTGNKEMIML